MNSSIETYLQKKILPVVPVENKSDAVPVAKAIQKGGLNVMEIPFRTELASESINEIRENFDDIIVGAGTILTPEQVHEAKKTGAQFGLAPGLNPEVIWEARKLNFPFIPGVMTPSDIEQALSLGCKVLKLFPAKQIGGVGVLEALFGPYSHTGTLFIPMGGVSKSNMRQYLDCPNVLAAGGSWLASKELIQKQNFQRILKNVEEALTVIS